MYNNYHTHTYRCKHAVGNVKDYVEEALKYEGSILGFSDHTPFPDNRWLEWRMNIDELKGYIDELNKACNQYSEKIKIYKGLESEYVPEFYSFYETLLNEYKLDYLSLGLHFYQYKNQWIHADEDRMNGQQLDTYAKFLVEGMETGFFKFVAHPDFWAASYLEWDKNAEKASIYIIENALRLNIPLEVNGNGFRKAKLNTSRGKRRPYPISEFWNIAAEYSIPVIIGSDAHKPCEVYDFQECAAFASSLGLNVIEKLGL